MDPAPSARHSVTSAYGHPERLLLALDESLDHKVQLIIYGRSAVWLGFDNPPAAAATTQDVDATYQTTNEPPCFLPAFGPETGPSGAGFLRLGPGGSPAGFLFFKAGGPLASRLLDHGPRILGDQGLELLVLGSVLGDRYDLIGRHITADGAAIFTALQVVIGAMGSLPHDTEFARFHALDLGNLLEQIRRRKFIHARNIYVCIYFVQKKRGKLNLHQNFVIRRSSP